MAYQLQPRARAGADMNARQSARAEEPFIVEPEQSHTHTFVLLHGLGSNGGKFGQELLESANTSAGERLQQVLPHAKFIFPTAHRCRSSAFRRSILTQWFDIVSLEDPSYRRETQYQGLSESAQTIREILNQESEHIPSSNIVLGGLSQGCAMALSVLLSLDYSLGGFVGMSGWLPLQTDMEGVVFADKDEDVDDDDNPFGTENDGDDATNCPIVEVTNFQREALCIDSPVFYPTEEHTALQTPVFIGHGGADEKIASRLGESAAETLRRIGLSVVWKLYPEQGHWYKIPDEIDDILEFLEKHTNFVNSEHN